MDLPAMAAKAAGAGMFFICNPNNPTGGVNSAASIDEFVAAVRSVSPDALILIDEAYFEYVEDPSYATAIPLTAKDPRIIVSRTFSKIHGMAGLRVGYAIGHPDALGAMRAYMSQGTISGLSASTALASLNDTAHMAKQVAMNKDARAYTVKAFTDAGFKVLPTQANFVMVDVKRDAVLVPGAVPGARRDDRALVPAAHDARARLDRHDGRNEAGDGRHAPAARHGARFGAASSP